jgi:hypothetical protein
VIGAVLVEVVGVFAIGKLCFLWWDGSWLRKVLMTGCAVVVLAALTRYIELHPFDF